MNKIRIFISSFKPLYFFYSSKQHSWLAEKLPGKWIRLVQWLILLFCILSGILLVILGFSGHAQNSNVLNYDLIWAEFIKSPFLFQSMVLIVWFIASIKPNPMRHNEYVLFSSLPVEPKRILDKFILSDVFRFSWMPIILAILLFGMLPFASLTFLSRAVLLSALFYLNVIAVMAFVHLFLTVKFKKIQAYNYLTRPNPLVQSILLIGYEGALLSFILIPLSVSHLACFIILLFLCVFPIILISLAEKLFVQLQQQNYWSHVSNSCEKYISHTGSLNFKFIEFIRENGLLNPLIIKKLIQNSRSKSRFTKIMLGGIFISLAYLLAMNNPYAEDRISVLYGLTLIYILLYGFKVINHMSPELESTKIIFTLPISKLQFYSSIFWPGYAWTFFIFTSMSILLLIVAGELHLIFLFWIKSAFAAILLLSVATNCGLANYPDIKKAQKHFTYWLLGLIFSCAFFYNFRIPIATIITIISYFWLKKVVYYRTHFNITKHSFI